MLTDFVDTRMREGDLVAIVRVVGGGDCCSSSLRTSAYCGARSRGLVRQQHPFNAFSTLATDTAINTTRMAAAAEDGAAAEFQRNQSATQIPILILPGQHGPRLPSPVYSQRGRTM